MPDMVYVQLPSSLPFETSLALRASPSPHRLINSVEGEDVSPGSARMLPGMPQDLHLSCERVPGTPRVLHPSRLSGQGQQSQCSSSGAIVSGIRDGTPMCRGETDMGTIHNENLAVEGGRRGQLGDGTPLCRSETDMGTIHNENLPMEGGRRGQLGDRLSKLDVQGIASLLKKGIALSEGKLIHEHILRSGLAGDLFLANLLITMYGRHAAMVDARLVFDNMPARNVVSWNAMIAAYSQQGYCNEALQLFHLMQYEGGDADGFTFVSVLNACSSLENIAEGKHGRTEKALRLFGQMQQEGVKPNKITFVSALSACDGPACLAQGKMIHSCILDGGLQSDIIVATALVNMYSKCGILEDARSVFDEMCQRTVVSWSAMIGAYAEHGHGREALQLFKQMQQEGVKANKVTFLNLLQACESLTDLAEGRMIHANILYCGFESDTAVGTAIINMYRNYRAVEDAHSTFDKMHYRNVFTWNSVIATHAEHGHSEKALQLFRSMEQEGIKPDDVTFLSVLSACASLAALDQGLAVHACIVDCGYDLDVVVGTALINMYGKCGLFEEAGLVFDKLVVYDVVSWNAMIGAYLQTGRDKDSFKLYQEMKHKGLKPDDVTFINVLSACANLVVRADGESIHASIIDSEFVSAVSVGNALIHMYGKCGFLEGAHLVFNRMHHRDVISWNTLMAVYNQQGHGKKAFQLFKQMQQECITPNEVTFVSLLSACSHAGLMVEAEGCFLSMTQDYGITPIAEHCRCMIDVLGRAGQLDDAEDFILKSQMQSDVLAWTTLLGACKIHGDVERAIRTAEHVIALDPQKAMAYVILSDIYAADGRWDDVQRVTRCMVDRGVKNE